MSLILKTRKQALPLLTRYWTMSIGEENLKKEENYFFKLKIK
jgi:hypothetical protein